MSSTPLKRKIRRRKKTFHKENHKKIKKMNNRTNLQHTDKKFLRQSSKERKDYFKIRSQPKNADWRRHLSLKPCVFNSKRSKSKMSSSKRNWPKQICSSWVKSKRTINFNRSLSKIRWTPPCFSRTSSSSRRQILLSLFNLHLRLLIWCLCINNYKIKE